MKFTTERETLLNPLLMVIGVVERRQTLPILSNILIQTNEIGVRFTATDLEVELKASVGLVIEQQGEATLPARKLLDICRTLPPEAKLTLKVDGDKALLTSGRSRFSLSTLPVKDFPLVDKFESATELELSQANLKTLIDSTQFSMAQQDVRYYLNGLLLEIQDQQLVSVATDGHRLSYCQMDTGIHSDAPRQIIIPRKGVQELSKLLDNNDIKVKVKVGNNHIAIETDKVSFVSKLIDGKFPDYDRVLPKNAEIKLLANRDTLSQALVRTSILSNEKYRGIRFTLSNNKLSIQAHNPDKEEAEEEMEVEYNGETIEIGFNVNYLLDALAAIPDENVQISMVDSNSSCLLQKPENSQCKYVIMPMRL